jgi:glycosyltransferase involved in cell wall biosynthesis
MPDADLISIVITTYNRSQALVPVLEAISAQKDRKFEVVVADDGSVLEHQTAIQLAAKRLGLPLTHVWHPDIGFTASRVRNLGVASSLGAYIVFLDGDCVPETDFVGQHRALAQTGFFVNGSRVLLSEKLSQAVIKDGERVFGRDFFFWCLKRAKGDTNKLTALWRMPDFGGRKEMTFRWKGIRSCNMGVWRKDYESINGFDESFVGWGHEDADFVLRMHNAGLGRKNGFFATEVYHLWHREASRNSESKNASTVRQRALSGQVLPTIGYSESRHAKDVVVSRWG